jgi:hypothetical protein
MSAVLSGPTQARQDVTVRAMLNGPDRVRLTATHYQVRPTVAGRSPSTEIRNARRWAPTWRCPTPTALTAILLRTQYNASHYTNSGLSYLKHMPVGGTDLGRPHESLSAPSRTAQSRALHARLNVVVPYQRSVVDEPDPRQKSYPPSSKVAVRRFLRPDLHEIYQGLPYSRIRIYTV